MRLLRRLRAGLPHRDPDGKIPGRNRPAGAFEDHDLRLLRRRLQLQGRNARQRSGAAGARQGRQGQSRPFLRQGPLRLGLCHPSRPDPRAYDPRTHQRPVARSVVGRGDRPRRLRIQARPGPIWSGGRGRHLLVALHQRGDLSRPEARAGRLRQQQYRYLRPGLPLAHRLRPQGDIWHVGRYPGFRTRCARATSSS